MELKKLLKNIDVLVNKKKIKKTEYLELEKLLDVLEIKQYKNEKQVDSEEDSKKLKKLKEKSKLIAEQLKKGGKKLDLFSQSEN